MKVFDIVCYPCGTQLVKRLVDVILRITLRVTEDNKGEGLGVVELLLIGAVLCLRRETGEAEKQDGKKACVHERVES